MTDAMPIYVDQDFYVPYFEIKLRGRPLGQDIVRDILQVSYKDDIKKIDSFDITINNWDAENLTFRYSDEDTFNPGQEIEVWMGYYDSDQWRLMLKGEITSLRPTFPASGESTLVISGLNLLHRLRGEQRTHRYEKLTDSEIARQIASNLKIDIRTSDEAAAKETQYEYLLQDNQYDIVFLLERAQRIGYDLFVEENTKNGQASEPSLYFGPSENVRQTTYELKYGATLIDFQPNLTTANQVGEVIVRGWDPVQKKKIEGKATRANLRTKGVGSKGNQQAIDDAFKQRKEVVVDRPVRDKAEADRIALEFLENIAKDMVKGSGSTIGLPDLRAGSILMMDGMGDRFSGRYFVTATTHVISNSGYTTRFECRREEV